MNVMSSFLRRAFALTVFVRPMNVAGLDGVDLEDLWSQKPVAYLSVAMPSMPNFFMLNGPNGPVGNFSLIDIAELQWDYIAQLMDLVRETGSALQFIHLPRQLRTLIRRGLRQPRKRFGIRAGVRVGILMPRAFRPVGHGTTRVLLKR